jgi:heat shock protein HslJ
MTKRIFKYFIGCSLFIHLGACSSFQSIEYTNNAITSVKWKLLTVRVSIYDRLIYPFPDNIPTLEIMNDDRIRGHSGCNTFGGNSTITGNTIKFEKFILTRKNCSPDRNELEDIVITALRRVNNYIINYSGNLLLREDNDVLMTYSPLPLIKPFRSPSPLRPLAQPSPNR